jgi:hypothetical protein
MDAGEERRRSGGSGRRRAPPRTAHGAGHGQVAGDLDAARSRSYLHLWCLYRYGPIAVVPLLNS